MATPTLTERQQEVYRVIQDWVALRGYAPTYAQIAEAIGVSSVSTVAEHVDNLVDKGYLRRPKGGAFGFVLNDRQDRIEEVARQVVEEAHRVDLDARMPTSLAVLILRLESELKGDYDGQHDRSGGAVGEDAGAGGGPADG